MRWLTGLFILVLILIVVLANQSSLPSLLKAVYRFPGGDKVGHFALMGILAFLVNVSLSARTIAVLSRRVLLGSVIVAAAVTLEEFTQVLISNRTFSLTDLTFDYLGIVCFSYLASWFSKRTRTT
ncbi:MAG: VanZ family protein [Anaerolineae bacterium]|nr:VanZ family protein [Anaerolineae bacterium]